MRQFFEEYKYLFIGLILSAVLHGIVFSGVSLIKEKKREKKEEKPIYISILHKPKEKSSQKKKIPKAATSPLLKPIEDYILPMPEPLPKKEKIIQKKIKKKRIVKKVKKRLVKKAKPKKKIKIRKKKKTVKKPVKNRPKKQVKKIPKKIERKIEKITQISNPPKAPPALKENPKIQRSISLADLKGKDNLFQVDKSPKTKEKSVSEEDILKYIRALERYLNNLARRRDLYPPMAKRLRLEGSLTVRFTIKKDGSVDDKSIKVMVSSGYKILDRGAVKLIKKYVPLFAKKEGKKPPRDNLVIELPVTFEIIGW